MTWRAMNRVDWHIMKWRAVSARGVPSVWVAGMVAPSPSTPPLPPLRSITMVAAERDRPLNDPVLRGGLAESGPGGIGITVLSV